LHGIETDTVVK
jgi:hypothetical protein